MSKRTIFLKLEVDWDDYDDVSDELLLEDTGILDKLKFGVSVKKIVEPYQYKISFDAPNYANPDFLPIATRPAAKPFTDEELDNLKKWLQSEEGKKKIIEYQETDDKIIDKLRDIDPKILSEPFDI